GGCPICGKLPSHFFTFALSHFLAFSPSHLAPSHALATEPNGRHGGRPLHEDRSRRVPDDLHAHDDLAEVCPALHVLEGRTELVEAEHAIDRRTYLVLGHGAQHRLEHPAVADID